MGGWFKWRLYPLSLWFVKFHIVGLIILVAKTKTLAVMVILGVVAVMLWCKRCMDVVNYNHFYTLAFKLISYTLIMKKWDYLLIVLNCHHIFHQLWMLIKGLHFWIYPGSLIGLDRPCTKCKVLALQEESLDLNLSTMII